MRLCHNKKALAFKKIISIMLVIASFAAIMFFITEFVGKAEDLTAETVCRASVVAREKTTIDMAGIDIQTTPLLCRTLDKKIPSKKDASKDVVMRGFAESMTRCWWQFGDGLIDDVFKEGNPTSNNCFMCYIAATKKTSDFKDEIDSREFLKYLVNTPYKIEIEGDKCKNLGGVCEKSKEICNSKNEGGKYWEYDENNLVCKTKYNQKENEKPVCCHSGYSCLNNGGECKEKGDHNDFVEYSKWDCPSDETCYIKDKNYVTYAKYIQSYSSKGNIIITTPIKPEQAYAVSFGSPTEKCGICQLIGAGAGATAGVIFTVYTAGAGAPSIATLASIGGSIAGAIGYVATGMGVDAYAKLFEREVNTIYLTTLDEALAEERCNRITDIKST